MSIEKRGKSSYRATAYNNGKRYRKTFKTKTQAMQWILAITSADDYESVELKGKTFRDLMLKYEKEVLPTKKTHKRMSYMLGIYCRFPVADVLLSNLSLRHFEEFFEQRINNPTCARKPSSSTLIHDKALFSAILNWGIKINWIKTNPVKGYKAPPANPPRQRIATPEEIQLLCDTVGWDRVSPPVNLKQRVVAAFIFSTLTGMRHGEIAKLQPSWIRGRYIVLPTASTKTAVSRNVALSKKAIELLNLMLSMNNPNNVFNIQDKTITDTTTFRNIREKAGLGKVLDDKGNVIKEGLNFHDGRATFATWAASARKNGAPHLDPMTLARQLGHTDVKMTMRYYRSTPEQVADMLDFE